MVRRDCDHCTNLQRNIFLTCNAFYYPVDPKHLLVFREHYSRVNTSMLCCQKAELCVVLQASLRGEETLYIPTPRRKSVSEEQRGGDSFDQREFKSLYILIKVSLAGRTVGNTVCFLSLCRCRTVCARFWSTSPYTARRCSGCRGS